MVLAPGRRGGGDQLDGAVHRCVEPRVVRRRHGDHLADHGDRDLRGEIGYQIRTLALLQHIQMAVRHLLDTVTKAFDRAGSERSGDQTA
ncbi:Uncharacterised protein [Mycobacteroides abscessus subsp. massiliense]|nr:Uncharacterised protein [Mycobacteroides abscessus subsp. massiliense]